VPKKQEFLQVFRLHRLYLLMQCVIKKKHQKSVDIQLEVGYSILSLWDNRKTPTDIDEYIGGIFSVVGWD
jgi:hypothetical protein